MHTFSYSGQRLNKHIVPSIEQWVERVSQLEHTLQNDDGYLLYLLISAIARGNSESIKQVERYHRDTKIIIFNTTPFRISIIWGIHSIPPTEIFMYTHEPSTLNLNNISW